jgi:XTP/dITP diphosphohydrolase
LTTLVIATKNRGKLEELRRIFGDLELSIVSADELGLPDVIEDAPTFEGNAIKKATELARASGHMTLGDDSGLLVDALGGAPGVLSARYAGVDGPGQAAANVAKLLAALDAVPDAARTARFRCVLALADPRGALGERDVLLAEGTCEGAILRAPRGGGGFGYDPIFVPRGETRTMAELPSDAKDRVSHRGAACALMRARLLDYLANRWNRSGETTST